jgi:hypothetical protein
MKQDDKQKDTIENPFKIINNLTCISTSMELLVDIWIKNGKLVKCHKSHISNMSHFMVNHKETELLATNV